MVHTKMQSSQNVMSEKVKVKGVRKWQKAYSCLSLSLSLSLAIAFLAISSTELQAKHKCRKSRCHDALPLVDVNTPLHVERDQFGRPTVVGNPEKGPKHGVNSYWYQVGKMWAEADAEDNFAVVVYGYLEAAGRVAEFVVDYDSSIDIHARRVTMTTPQYEQQLMDQAGNYPQEVIDFLDGVHQGYLNHIVKIQNGEQPLPADFVSNEFGDVGILNWFWSDVQDDFNVARELFTIINYIRCYELVVDNFGSGNTSFEQFIFGVLFGQQIATETDPSGGEDAVKLCDDILGVPGMNFRFTAAEGDRAGIYCPTGTASSCLKKSSIYTQSATQSKNQTKRRNISPTVVQNFKQLREQARKINHLAPEKRHMSDFLIVGSELTKTKSTMMFGNPQLSYGFDGGFDASGSGSGVRTVARFSFNTPRGAYYAPQWFGSLTRSETGYPILWSVEVTQVASRDGVYEDSTSLTLLYNENTDIENVPGGKEQSRIKIRAADGTVSEIFTTIYQDYVYPGLEFDLRFPDPNNPDNEFVCISRRPCDWMQEVAGIFTALGTRLGMVPFNSVEQFADRLSHDPHVLMYGGLDNKGNIFTISGGLYPTIITPNFNRQYPGDATASKFFENLIARPLPVAQESEYICAGSKVAKNPSCGFITAWNNMWSNNDQQGADSSSEEYHHIGSVFYAITKLVEEKGKLDFEDIQDLWTLGISLTRGGNSVVASEMRRVTGANAFPVVCRDEFFEALDAKGILVGLTQEEIDRTKQLLGLTYDGRAIPFVDENDLLNGSNYDGRWVLSQLWLSILHRNIWVDGIEDQLFRETVASIAVADLTITEPTGDWTKATPFDSRVIGTAISCHSDYSNPLLLRIMQIGPDLGNPLFYDWYGHILSSSGFDLTNLQDRQTYIALALKQALEFQVTGSNAGTGLEDPLTSRANLNLIQDDGIPLHPGWGKGQRPTILDDVAPPYSTQFLVDNIQLKQDLPTVNSEGQRFYAERDCKGCLKHLQSVPMVGYSSLITNNMINGENVVTVQPHATDADIYFRGNLVTDEIPYDIKKKRKHGHCHKKHKKH